MAFRVPENGQYSDEESGGYHGNGQDSSGRELDRLLPIANVGRIMKRGLPANAKISKDAKETVQECVSEFISFITGEASDRCQKEKRKTINGDDLLWAISTLGFEDYIEPLKAYLGKYREMEVEKTSMARQGDQVIAKEGNSSNVSSACSGGMYTFNGGTVAGNSHILQRSHGHQPPSVLYSQQQQFFTPYQVLYSSTGSLSVNSGAHFH
eukprot:c23598_g1_i3 orf=844-1473(+)